MVKVNVTKRAPVRSRPLVVVPPKKRAPVRRVVRPRARENSAMLADFGQAAGTYLGGPVGGQLGRAAGKLISRITGFGDYKIEKNSITSGQSIPTFQTGSDGVRICHREFLTDIKGSVGFELKSYSINPGLVASFPYLARVAANFEEYQLDGLVYEYRPSSGSAISSTSSALGVVVMATDYDATNPSFSSKQVMESYEFSTSTVPNLGGLHPVECKRKLNVMGSAFIRTGSTPVSSDLRLFDHGNFQIATSGMQSVYTVGELWVTYDVLLRKPRIPTSISFPSYAMVREDPPLTATSGTGALGTNGGVVYNNLLGISCGKDATSSFIVLPNPGNFVITVFCYGTAITPTLGANVQLGPSVFSGQPTLYVPGSVTMAYSYSAKVINSGSTSANYWRFSTNTTILGFTYVSVYQVDTNPNLSLSEFGNNAFKAIVASDINSLQKEEPVGPPNSEAECEDEKSSTTGTTTEKSVANDPVKRPCCPCGFELTSNGAFVYVCDECRKDESEAEERLHQALQKFHFKPG